MVKNPPCNEWDVGSILGQGTKTPHAVEQLQASLVGQQINNPPAVQETRFQSLGQEDPLEKERQPTPVLPCLEDSMNRGVGQLTVHGIAKSQT